MKYLKYPLTGLLLLTLILPGISQTDNADQIKAAKRADLLRQMDKGVSFMETGNYTLADKQFRFLLENMEAVPANLAYYIGKNSYYLKQYKQSIDWLNKYIQLKGTKGQFYLESVELLKSAEEQFLEMNSPSTRSPQKLDSLLNNNKIDCGPAGLVICPVCKGRSVIIEKGVLGDSYRPCPYSDESGFLTCDEYNLLLNGKLKPKF